MSILFNRVIFIRIILIIFFCTLSIVNAYTQENQVFNLDEFSEGEDVYIFSDPLDISTKSQYARINLYIDISSGNKDIFRIYNILRKYLLVSGVFNTEVEYNEADLVLFLSDSIFAGLDASFTSTQSDTLIYKQLIKLSNKKNQLEANILSFVEDAILAIDNRKSLFKSAILYSRKWPNGASDIMLTDFLGKNHYVIIKNGYSNILPVWAVDGKRFMYTTMTPYGTKVYIWDFESSKNYLLTKDTGLTGGSFLPGERFIITHHVSGVPSLYVYYANTGKMHPLIVTDYINTGGSVNDNNQLLHVSNRAGGVQIFLKDLYPASAFQKRLTFVGSNNSEPKWSHNGDLFSYTSYFQGNSQIFIMSEDGKRLKQITHDAYNSEQSSWSADDRQIIYTSFTSNKSRITFITLDGKFKRRLNNNPLMPSEAHPAWTNNFNWKYLVGFSY